MIGRSFLDFIPAPSNDRLRRGLATLTPQAPGLSLDFPTTDSQGTNRWASWSFKADFDEDGAIRSVIAIGRVIADDLRYRNALEDLLHIANNLSKTYEERARMIMAVGVRYFEAELAGITRFDGDNAIPVFLNFEQPHIRENHPIPRARSYIDLVLRAGPTVAIHDTTATEYVDYPFFANLPLKSVIASEIYLADKFYGIINFGTLVPRDRPFTEQQIQFCRLVAQWLGYTLEQQQMLLDLEASRLKYQHIFERAPMMMAVLDEQHNLLDVNHAWQTKLDYAPEEVVGRPITDFYTPESAKEAFELEITDRPATVNRLRRDFVARDGSRVETQVSSLKVGERLLPALAVMLDITERNNLQIELTVSNQALIRANEELKRFNTVAAHDLQEPLRKIRLFGDLLMKRLTDHDTPDAKEALDVVTRAADRLSRLVHDLLAFSRESERGYAQTAIALAPLIDEVISDLALMITETGARIDVHDLPDLIGDAVPLQRLFHNLIINALKYRRPNVAPEIDIFSRTSATGTLEIVVRDNGVGLPPGQEEKIFEPFIRLHSRRSAGSGIGLALCRSIAEGHGWTISARNRPEGGSDFIVTTLTRAEPA